MLPWSTYVHYLLGDQPSRHFLSRSFPATPLSDKTRSPIVSIVNNVSRQPILLSLVNATTFFTPLIWQRVFVRVVWRCSRHPPPHRSFRYLQHACFPSPSSVTTFRSRMSLLSTRWSWKGAHDLPCSWPYEHRFHLPSQFSVRTLPRRRSRSLNDKGLPRSLWYARWTELCQSNSPYSLH